MKLSIVIPAYNEEKYLSKCLESLKNQTYKNVEIIIVDNGSTDQTVEIAKKYDTTIIQESKKGVGAARKKGFAQAQGDIIVSTDADCSYPSDWLEKITRAFEKPDTIAVYGTTMIENESPWKQKFSLYLMTAFYQINDWLNKKQFQGSNSAVRKTAYEKTSGFDETLGALEDADLCKKLMKLQTPESESLAKNIIFDPSIIITTSSRRLKQGNFLKTLKMYLIWYYKTWWMDTTEKLPPINDIR